MTALRDRYFAPEVPTRLAALRILVGLFGTVFLIVRTGYLFGVARLPAARFDPIGPLWFLHRPVAIGLVHVVVVVAIALGVMFALGWRYRITGPVYALVLLTITTYDNSWQHIAHAENLFTLHTLVLGFAPAADAWSFDARRRRADDASIAREAYGWPVRLISVITVCTYLLAGWAKLRHGGVHWITGDVLRNQIAQDNVRKSLLGDRSSPIGRHLVLHGWVFPPLAAASVFVEMGALLALMRGWPRRAWVSAAWLFHVGVLAIMAILFIYPLTGIAFASMGHPDELWQRWRARRAAGAHVETATDAAYGRARVSDLRCPERPTPRSVAAPRRRSAVVWRLAGSRRAGHRL